MNEKPEALEAAESLEQAIQFYSAGLESDDNHMTLLAFAADKFRRLHAENERLREALKKYGQHDVDCMDGYLNDGPWPCDCGLETVLQENKT